MFNQDTFKTKLKLYILNILCIEIKDFQYTKKYYLFGFIPLVEITRYPKVEVYHAEN